MAENAADEARLLISVGRYDDAADAARRGLAGDPNNARLLGLLALALDGVEQHTDARHWAEKALSIDPQQAWIHNVRAMAILNGGGRPRDAVRSAEAAVAYEPNTPEFRYTLAYAYGRTRKGAEARRVAASIRTVDPTSPLGPLAEALTELCRVRVFAVSWWWALIAILITRGIVLVIWAVIWVALAMWRRGPLRRADAHLVEALRLDPGNATTLALVAQVARLRFRYLQSLEAGVAAAMIDAGLVKADDMARQIARRSCVAALVAFVVWLVAFLVLYDNGTWAVGVSVTGLLGVASVYWVDRSQTSRLPAGVVHKVRQRWSFVLLTGLLAALALAAAISSVGDRGIVWAAVLALPGLAAAVGMVVLAIQVRTTR